MISRIQMTLPLCAFLLASFVLAGCGPSEPDKRPPPEVGVVVIHPQNVELKTVLPGRTDSYVVSEVRPQVSGIVKERLFKEGANVTAGQPLYKIDSALYQAAYDNARAALSSAKAKAARFTKLLKLKAIARQDYDNAQAAYKQALANAQTARINLDRTTIKAAISGRISRSSVTQGALVSADQPTALATIQTLDPIYVDIAQSSTQLLDLKQAMQDGQMTRNGPGEARVTLQLDNGTKYPLAGTLQFSEVTVDPNTGEVTLRAIFPNPDNILLPGMFVRATIVEGVKKNAILAPQQGISHNEKGEATAMIADAKGIARLRILKVSRAIGDKWLVTDGLKPGDKLIVEGLQRVQPDSPVHAVPASYAKTAEPGEKAKPGKTE